TEDKIMAVIAAADAATAAGLNAADSTKISQAKLAATAAYDAAVNAAKTAAPTPPPPANATLPPQRLLGGGAYRQKVKATGGLHDALIAEPPAPLEKLLRMGATMERSPIGNVTAVPSIGKTGTVDNTADLQHICGRHTREFFTFNAQELAPTDPIM